MNNYTIFVGMDVHKSTVAVAIAEAGRKKPVSYGIIENSPQAIARMAKKLSKGKTKLTHCYEAGPCGYGVYRQIISLGHSCDVVAPSLIPRKTGDRIKTDRRDAMSLARLYRSGELTAVWVPDQEQEAMRDLMRARGDMKAMELQARQRLNALLLRHGRIHSGRRWTKSHHRWLEELRFDQPVQQIVFVEYMDCLQQARMRVRDIEQQIDQAWSLWKLAPAVEALMALRGVDLIPR